MIVGLRKRINHEGEYKMNIKLIEEMLLKFKSIPKIKEKKPTFLEIAGFPHYENVISNIVSFFVDTTEAHGLEDLLIKSILEAAKPEKIIDYKIVTTSVQREVITKNNKRIDILIETEDEIICIENKIFADLYNDLSEYAKYVSSNNTLKKDEVNIVLSMDKVNSNLLTDNFINITYQELFEKINENIGHYISYINSDYLKYLLDFKFTITNLYGGEKMDKEIKEFFSKNWDTILELKNEMNKLENIIKEKAEKIRQLIDLSENKYTSNWIFEKRCVVHDIKLDEKTIIAIDYYTELQEPYFKIFIRKGKSVERLNIIKEILEENIEKEYNISLKTFDIKGICIKNSKSLTFDTDERSIAQFIKKLVNAIEEKKERILA